MKVYKSGDFDLGGRTSTRSRRSGKKSSGSSGRDAVARKSPPRKPRRPKRRSRRRPLATILSVIMVLAGLGLVGSTVFSTDAVSGIARSIFNPAPVPNDTEMTLTVPKLARVDGDPVYTAAASDTGMLDQGAVHVEGTGYPWDAEANVYIAGHRLGYAGSGSFLQFYDLDKLKNGDEIIIKDSNGTTYTYTVFDKMRVLPTDSHVLDATPGKNIVSLQTCTLPNYSHRLIVQGELTSVA